MSAQPVKLLHVEDNVADRLLLARLLGTMKEYTFNIIRAATEITAVAELNKGGVEFVVLDYKLPLGDGLGCLKKLRQLDPIVPILVVSGMSTPDIASECMIHGADDFLNKQDLTAEKLAASVRKAIGRALAWPALRDDLTPICKHYLTTLGDDFFKALDAFARSAFQGGLTPDQLPGLFETVANDLAPDRAAVVVPYLRPLILELQHRLANK